MKAEDVRRRLREMSAEDQENSSNKSDHRRHLLRLGFQISSWALGEKERAVRCRLAQTVDFGPH